MTVFDRPAVLVVCALYLGVVLVIGWASARRTRTAQDFYVAGRRLGLWVTTLAAMSAALSGFVFLGGPGLTYRLGVSAFFINAPLGFTAALLGWTLAKRLRLLAEKREIYTLSDALAARYDSPSVAAAGAVAVIVGSLGYLGAQIQALGVLVARVFGLDSPALAMAAGLAVVLIYTVAGGMTAGVYTDLFQSVLMMGGAAAVFAYALRAGGGWSAITDALAASAEHGEAFLLPAGTVPWATVLGFFFVFGVGVLGQPQMLHKFFMLRDPRQLRWMPLALGGSQAVCLLIWVGVGLAVPALVAGGALAPPASPDDAAPVFLLAFTPDLLAGLVIAGVLAAIMSTADSFLLLAAAALVRDLPRAWGRPVTDELRRGRWAMVAFAIPAAVFAHLYDDLIALLGTFAFGTFAAALTPALAVGLNWKRVTAPAAGASIVVGLVANLGLEVAARWELLPLPPGVLPSALSLCLSFLILLAVTLLTPERSLPADVEAILDA